MKKFEKKVWLSSPTMHGPEIEYVKEAYETNWMSTVGANINEVERLACEKTGCAYAVALSAGTAALHMAVKLAGVKPENRVFCSDMTFDATVNPVYMKAAFRFLLIQSTILGIWIRWHWKKRLKCIRK